ncbi:hypothetical protein [Bradyrhizobium phage BDU-MI-1]|nr:hypothetical protein [Bradyrhizobium phage BDU-MI-1]
MTMMATSGLGWIMASREVVYDKMLEMLDRIHKRFHEDELVVRPGPDDPDLDVEDLMNEIGCLIAEAKGEYDPEESADAGS